MDRDAVKAQLLDSQVGIAGRETAIGDAIGLAVKRLRDRPQEQRVLILLTDGVNTAGALEPSARPRLAKAENVRVYTIGMGSDRSGGLFGMAFSTNSAEIDEAALKAIAQKPAAATSAPGYGQSWPASTPRWTGWSRRC